jgi:UDP-N-acetylglucosamine 2-epimerase (non-hydrolysing)
VRIVHVVGARPNFVKVAPVVKEMARHRQLFDQTVVHTGQHYDDNMSRVFFEDLELPKDHINLEIGSGTHAQQTARIMVAFEDVVRTIRPDWAILPGDVNSTLACALVCSKIGIKTAHLEAGLRSFDRSMPEEVNRVVTDHVSDILFATAQDAVRNLMHEGINSQRVYFVGNTMIDSLVSLLPKAQSRWPELSTRLRLNQFVLVTLHRPSNVDDDLTFAELMEALVDISKDIQVVFPIHPRTRMSLTSIRLNELPIDRITLIDPAGYLDFLALEANAQLVVTDSGGIQEETTYLGIPCLTVRSNTERPVTITHGTNRLVGGDRRAIVEAARATLSGSQSGSSQQRPPLWDGKAAERVVEVMRSIATVSEGPRSEP